METQTESEDQNEKTWLDSAWFNTALYIAVFSAAWYFFAGGDSNQSVPTANTNATPFAPPKPSYEILLSESSSQIIDIGKCKRAPGYIDCVMSYKLAQGYVTERSFIAAFYDRDDVKLGTFRFPDQIIQPSEKIKSTLLIYSDTRDIAKVVINSL